MRGKELALAVTDQLTVLPEVEADAQGTLEVAEVDKQSAGLGIITIKPADSTGPIFRLVLLNA
jgi:hypothetical protein